MNRSKQAKKQFLNREGDLWLKRNINILKNKDYSRDPIAKAIVDLPACHRSTSILEIGCSHGDRLKWLKQVVGAKVFGIDPSRNAVAFAKKNGVTAFRGTADCLPFPEKIFDIVIFGFCLYLCDRDDLFQIANEADRVLKKEGWIVIFDFYQEVPFRQPYVHKKGIFSYKMDYRSLFTWNPNYVCFKHEVLHHQKKTPTDKKNEWVALSILRKKLYKF